MKLREPELTGQLISAVFIGLLLYIFVPGQIYRAPKLSPLGLRAGYVGIALIPFVYTFGSRINPLGWLSRVSHERWMVYHQYGARIVRESWLGRRVANSHSPDSILLTSTRHDDHSLEVSHWWLAIRQLVL